MIPISPEMDFSWLIGSVSKEAFLTEFYERRTLLLHRGRPDFYAGLISADDLKRFVVSRPLYGHQIFAVDARREIETAEYTLPNRQVDPARLDELFAQGATISLRQMQDSLPSLAKLCRAAEQALSCPFQANIYHTPPDAQGFKVHHDTHDVFVLQISGSKRWRTYEPVVELPLPGQSFEEVERSPGACTEQFTLQAGDLFYCPRGIPHDAEATDQPSLHVTLGALAYRWADVMLEAMADVCLTDPAFRASLPPGFVGCGVEPDLEKTFHDMVRRFSQSARLRPALDGIAERFVTGRKELSSEPGPETSILNAITLDSAVGARADLVVRLHDADQRVVLRCGARELSFPIRVAVELKYVLETPRFVVRDLPGPLDEAGKLLLVRRLVQEGLVVAHAAEAVVA